MKNDYLKNKKILITGSSGLVGASFIESLSGEECEIWAWVKNDVPPYLQNILNKCHIIKKDLTERESFSDLPQFDIIIHSAGYAQPMKFLADKTRTIEINTMSTIWLMDKLLEGGKFLFISSSEIYNGLDKYDIKETDIGRANTDHPRSCYITSKKCGESICYSYINDRGIDAKIARLGLTYGPYVKIGDKRVINTLIEKAIFEKEISLLDGGDAIRTFCFITDAVEMMWNILLNGKNVVYNVGGIYYCSILDIAKKIGRHFDKEIVVPIEDKKLEGSPKIVNIDISRYLLEFGNKSFVKIDDGIEKTIEWIKYIHSF